MSGLYEAYQRVFNRHRFLFVAVFALYAAAIVTTIFYSRAVRESIALKERIALLNQELSAKAVASPGTPPSTLLPRSIEFTEEWKDEKTKSDVMRLLDYAAYAEQKGDLSYAERIYGEADQRQRSLAVEYDWGRNAYHQGKLEQAIVHWGRAVDLDGQGKYPDLRLYLGLALRESNKTTEARKILTDYLKMSASPVGTPSPAPTAAQPSLLAIDEATVIERANTPNGVRFVLRIAVGKHREIASFDHTKVKIQVFFYDTDDKQDINLTDATVNYEWVTPNHDWAKPVETLDVSYSREKAESKRRYFGYVVRVYYNEQLQAQQADPERLLSLFPSPLVTPE
jgi:tetratricopeptide (TPR) repeat protein